MILKGKYRLLLLIAEFIILSACTERIEIALDNTYTRLIVYGEITTENKNQTIQLTASSDYFYNQPAPAVTGALVEVNTETTSYFFQEDSENPGLYVSQVPFSASEGTTYNLIINDVDIDQNGIFETYSASSITPAIGTVDSISITYFESPFANGYQISMYAFDPPTKEYYSYKLIKNGILLTDTLIKYSVQTDDFYNGQYVFGLPVGFLNDSDSAEAAIPGDEITFELNSITQEFYDFIVGAQSEVFGTNPLFGGPPANISTNMNKGALGIFTVTSLTSVSDSIRTE